MDTSRERDQSIDRWLRRSLRTPRPTETTVSCLDAETVAAWLDGGLSGTALEIAQSHVADCERCQSMVGAMTRINAAVTPPTPVRSARRWLPWLVPVTAAAAAVALWVAVPGDLSTPPRATEDVRTQPREPGPQQTPSLDKQTQPSSTPSERAGQARAGGNAQSAGSAPELRRNAERSEADGLPRQDALSAPAEAAPSAPAPVAAPQAARSAGFLAGTAALEILSPNPAVRWRILGSVISRSVDGGATWDAVSTDVAAGLTAGAAPSTTVCWLVGREGIVWLSTDGRAFQRVAFPEVADLSGVQATDARSATVTTADGRRFATSDGGVSWEPR